MTVRSTASSFSETSSPSALSSFSASSAQEQDTMVGALSLPTTPSSSLSSEDSPTSLPTSSSITSALLSTMDAASAASDVQLELERIQELEQKRLALRHQRFSLEQKLYEFCGKHTEGLVPPKPTMHVLDFAWKDKTTGIRVVYSGPLNDQKEPHGNDCIMKFSDGQFYRGDVRNGCRSGAGANSWPDGQDYTGEWKQNSRNGKGTHTWPDGRKVAGQWKDGHLHGKAYFSWPNGSTYEGMCKMGKKHGRGKSSNHLHFLGLQKFLSDSSLI